MKFYVSEYTKTEFILLQWTAKSLSGTDLYKHAKFRFCLLYQSYKQLSAFEGHEDAVNAIAVYDDKATGKVFIISASDDKTVGVYEKSSKLPQKVLKGHTGWVYAVAADDKHIYSAGFDGLVHVWDWDRSAAAAKDAQPTYQLKYTWKGHTGKINSICVDPSSSMIYTGSSDGTIMVWDKTVCVVFFRLLIKQQPNTDGPVSIFRGHTDGVHCVYSYKERLYSASYDRSVKIWEKAVLFSLSVFLTTRLENCSNQFLLILMEQKLTEVSCLTLSFKEKFQAQLNIL